MGPGRLVGTLMPYETRAVDRAEMFKPGRCTGLLMGSCCASNMQPAGSPDCAVHSRSYRKGGRSEVAIPAAGYDNAAGMLL